MRGGPRITCPCVSVKVITVDGKFGGNKRSVIGDLPIVYSLTTRKDEPFQCFRALWSSHNKVSLIITLPLSQDFALFLGAHFKCVCAKQKEPAKNQ